MSKYVVTSQPRTDANITSAEPLSPELKCRNSFENQDLDDNQCCFVYFYKLYFSWCRCFGCCTDKKNKRTPHRSAFNNNHTRDNELKDDNNTTYFLNNEYLPTQTYSDHTVNHERDYTKMRRNSWGDTEDINHSSRKNGDSDDHGGKGVYIDITGDLVSHNSGGSNAGKVIHSGHISAGRHASSLDHSGTGHSENVCYPGVNSGGESHSAGNYESHTQSGDHGGHSGVADSSGWGDTGGDNGGGDTGGYSGGCDTGGDTGGDSGFD